MLTTKDYEDAPEDPALAFIYLEDILRNRIERALSLEDVNNTSWIYVTYMSKILAIKKELNLDILNNWSLPSTERVSFDKYVDFQHEVDHFVTQMQLRYARRQRQYSVALDSPTKAKMRHHLNQIKEIVDRLDASLTRKQALYNKISALDAEINRDRTRFEALADLWISGCAAFGEGFEHLRPSIEAIGTLMGRAKEKEDEQTPKLPPHQPPKRIEPPHKAPAPRGRIVDDDIPF